MEISLLHARLKNTPNPTGISSIGHHIKAFPESHITQKVGSAHTAGDQQQTSLKRLQEEDIREVTHPCTGVDSRSSYLSCGSYTIVEALDELPATIREYQFILFDGTAGESTIPILPAFSMGMRIPYSDQRRW